MVPTGRFAPSPSGRMHLGNIYAALMSWLSARSAGGRWILRIEDLDPGRSRIEYARLIEDDLKWLGLEWDEGGLTDGLPGPYCQSMRGDLYASALARLEDQGLVYACHLSVPVSQQGQGVGKTGVLKALPDGGNIGIVDIPAPEIFLLPEAALKVQYVLDALPGAGQYLQVFHTGVFLSLIFPIIIHIPPPDKREFSVRRL